MNKHIITSLGKGDALMCYGIFVELSKAYDHIYYHVNISIYEEDNYEISVLRREKCDLSKIIGAP